MNAKVKSGYASWLSKQCNLNYKTFTRPYFNMQDAYIDQGLELVSKNKGVNGINYQVAETQWKYYCTQARNAANYQDIAKYASFMNQWVRLIPEINHHESDFGELGTRETLNRH